MSQTESVRIDGRSQRSAETRREILRATRELILRGTVDPTASDIAAMAGVTTRTLFRHFPDMQALHRGFVEAAEASASLVMEEPFPDGPPEQWQQLLQVIVERRVRVYESMLPLYLSPIWSRYRAAVSDSIQRRAITRRRKRLRQVLPDAIMKDTALFEALDGVLSIEYWISLRRDQRLGVPTAARVLRLVVEKLTAGE